MLTWLKFSVKTYTIFASHLKVNFCQLSIYGEGNFYQTEYAQTGLLLCRNELRELDFKIDIKDNGFSVCF